MRVINIHNYEAFLLDFSEGHLSAEEIANLKAFALAHPEIEIDLTDFELLYLSDDTSSFDLKDQLKKTEASFPDEDILNYLEGNLSFKQRFLFESKLSRDHDLKKDLDLYLKTILVADPGLSFEVKANLFKTEEDLVLNDKLMSYFENQLFLPERIEFEKELLSNNSLQNELILLSKTTLSADNSVTFPYKEDLKKEARIIPLFNFRSVASVAASLLLLIGLAIVFNYYQSELYNKQQATDNTDKSIKTSVPPLKKSSDVNGKAPNLTITTASGNSIDNESAKMIEKKSRYKKPELKTESILTIDKPGKIDMENELVTERDKNQLVTNSEIKDIKPEPVVSSNSAEKKGSDSVSIATNLIELEEIEDMESPDVKDSSKKGFWKRAVQVAKQANKLGVKSVDGQENLENKYRLSFNSFSVEKK